MNTPTHMLIAAAVLTRPGPEQRLRNALAVIGGLTPDLALVTMFLWSKAVDAPPGEVWRVWYFNPPWQTVMDLSHSIPLYTALLAFGLWRAGRGSALAAFALAALLHIAVDLPVHTDDAYASFTPFSQWRFRSGVSYWDRSAYADWVAIAEMAFAALSIGVLWQRFRDRWLRAILIPALAIYLLPILYFVTLGRFGSGLTHLLH